MKKLIPEAFWHRFWDDVEGSGNAKNEQKRRRVALFLIFEGCNISRRFWSRFGRVLGRILGAFWAPKSTQDWPSWAQDGS